MANTDVANRHSPTTARALPTRHDESRAKAFARARRHGFVVRALRVLFPIAAVGLFASYGLFVQRSISVGSGQFSIGPITVSGENLIASRPHYDGVNKDGSRFDVRAQSAEHNFRQTGPIKLKIIDGTLIEPNNTKTLLKAARGSFDTQSNVLELYERIEVTSESGLTAELTQATVYTKENRIVSKEPVAVRMPTGTVNGNEMVLLQKKRHVTFSKGVTAVVQPQERPANASATPASARLFGASNAPINVTSATLEIDDNANAAVFKGDVRAKQAEATLIAPELEVRYERQPGGSTTTATDTTSRLKRLIVPRDVVLMQGTDQATSERAEFNAETDKAFLLGNVVITSGRERQAVADRADIDTKADTTLLTGNVVLTQGKNVLNGRRLFVDRNAKTSRITSPVDQGGSGRIWARFYRAAADGAPPKTKAAAASAAAQADPLGVSFQTDPTLPIDIEADMLDADDNAKTATFTGQVKAVQGEFTVTTPELVALYTGEATVGVASQLAPSAPAQLKSLHAKKRVVITKEDQKASGDRADFDVRANTVTLTGDVVLTKNRQVINGPKLVIDLTTGISRMDTAQPRVAAPVQPITPTAGRPNDAPPAVPATGPNAVCPPGRMCGLFYLDEMKKGAKEKSPALEKHKAPDAKAPHREDAGGKGAGTSSWNSGTETFGDRD